MDQKEYLLVQMPPGSNIEKAKREAEEDNRLRFYEESPKLLEAKKQELEAEGQKISGKNWQQIRKKYQEDKNFLHQAFEPRFEDEIHDPKLAEKIFSAKAPKVLEGFFETQTEVSYTVGKEGKVQIDSFPEALYAKVFVKKKPKAKEKKRFLPRLELGISFLDSRDPAGRMNLFDINPKKKQELRQKKS